MGRTEEAAGGSGTWIDDGGGFETGAGERIWRIIVFADEQDRRRSAGGGQKQKIENNQKF